MGSRRGGRHSSAALVSQKVGCDLFVVPVVLLSEDKGSVSRPGLHARADPHNPRQA